MKTDKRVPISLLAAASFAAVAALATIAASRIDRDFAEHPERVAAAESIYGGIDGSR